MEKSLRFLNKTAIVTGGASGIGKCLTELLRTEGARVVVFDKAAPDGDIVDESISVDVASESDIERAVSMVVERLGKIDMLANCAGISHKSSILETSLKSWNEVIGVNLTGTFLVSRETAKAMVKTGGGSIVNIASVDAHAADPDFASYNTSKAAILGLTRSFAVELGRQGVRVNSVSPGLVLTPMVAHSSSNPAILKHLQEDFRRVPMGRAMQPLEIAKACSYLLSEDASGVTGSDLIVDGGMMADSFLMNSLPA
ncbi:SDR family NAD(P)-dependent oxidoreductase [Phyllobacterium zundukense]|uniref:Short-chain dehydrogenase n=1 Tax=Phyllobacterium zundukense TaxID=1867719 RepID=A0A2N9VUR5_9HYPH|nr:SDR family oxidoreductase [Phyllobacterium zundukense]ATU95313.1 hypothetical protein BLM14_26745 [Phyllobacterium zundukense]PIO43233.1 hypothetical protein B5P45_19340 [Phyllobacterium zundukense]